MLLDFKLARVLCTYEEMKAKYCGTNIRRKPKDEEHKIQVSMVNWFRLQYPSMRHNLFSVPNGGRRDAVTGAKLKDRRSASRSV